MPSPEALKNYQPGFYYHIYNRGVNRANIFFESNDYWVYRRCLRATLEKTTHISLKLFALLPNHFHLLVFQESERAIETFMRRLSSKYSRYIQKKYNRVGHLYQGVYKAKLIADERQLAVESNYILQNPIRAGLISWKHVGENP